MGGSGGIIVNKEGEYEIARFADGTIRWAFNNANPGWVWINTGYVAKANEWTHIAVVYDNGDVRTYADGQLVHFFDGAGLIGDFHPGVDELRIGDRSLGIQRFQGQIDEVRVWTTTRSQPEIRDNMNRQLAGDAAGLGGYWKFDDQTSGTGFGSVRDSSGNGNHGFVAGGAVRSVGPIRIDARDTLGDPVLVHVVSDTPQVKVEMLDATNLLITELPGFDGTAVITVTAFDGLGAAGDPHGRQHAVTFEYTTGTNSAQAIYGVKFNDLDGDGVRDAGEPGIDGIQLFLDQNGDGLLDSSELVTYTDANGDYGFRGLDVVAPVAHGPAVLVGTHVGHAERRRRHHDDQRADAEHRHQHQQRDLRFRGRAGEPRRPRVRRQRRRHGAAFRSADRPRRRLDRRAAPALRCSGPGAADGPPARASSTPSSVRLYAGARRSERHAGADNLRRQRQPLHFRHARRRAAAGHLARRRRDGRPRGRRGADLGRRHRCAARAQADLGEGAALLASFILGDRRQPGQRRVPRRDRPARGVEDRPQPRGSGADFDELDPASSGLSAYWKLDEGQGDTAFDLDRPEDDGQLPKDPLDPAWFGGDEGEFAFEITLTPQDTLGNKSLQDLRDDLNRLLAREAGADLRDRSSTASSPSSARRK